MIQNIMIKKLIRKYIIILKIKIKSTMSVKKTKKIMT